MRPYDGGLILLVEDNDLVRWAVEEGLREAGWAVLSAPTGEMAIQEFEQGAGRVAALLTDILLPGDIDGWDVARRCRALSPYTPVLYMTGHPWHVWSTLGVPGSTVLEKPFTDQQLTAALQRLANHSLDGMSAVPKGEVEIS